MSSERKSARFIFERPDDYEPIYVNGVYGGVTPRGELIAHFFLEYEDVPKEEHVPIEKGRLHLDGLVKIRKTKDPDDVAVFRRDVKVGIIIPVHQVHSIANWMLDKLKSSPITVEEIKEDK